MLEEGATPPLNDVARAGDLDTGSVIPSWQIRNKLWAANLPAWRTWSELEELSLQDHCLCPLTLDAISVFGVRPPELRWVRQPHLYYRWFYRDGRNRKRGTFKERIDYLTKVLDCDYEQCAWVDGTDCRVYVRKAALPEILDYLEKKGPNEGPREHRSFYPMGGEVPEIASQRSISEVNNDGQRLTYLSLARESPYKDVYSLFAQLRMWDLTPPRKTRLDQVEQWECLQALFFGDRKDDVKIQRLPVVWFNSVKPSEPVRWLVHLLLSMGEFDCEAGLLESADMVKNFTRAGLIRQGRVNRQEDVCALTRRYVLEQLVFLPGGTYSFDKNVVEARRVLQAVLVDETMPISETPAGLYTHVRQATEKSCRKHLDEIRDHLCEVMWDDVNSTGMFVMPCTKQSLKDASPSQPIEWTPELCQTPLQSDESFAEQKLVIAAAKAAISKYQQFTSLHPKGVIAAGGPGSGKTSCLQSIGLIARSKGLNVGMTAVMCERALQLGGTHLARFCKFPAGKMSNPCRFAELSICKLMRSAKDLEYIRSLDVLLIDEMGNVSAELISALDIIFRRVRNNSAFFGGMLVFGSMDCMQLRPVEGRPPLLSPQVTSCFDFLPLDHSVRAAQCGDLQRLIQICRLSRAELTEEIRTEFMNLIKSSCTFVSNWDDPRLLPDMLRMFATHNARREAESRLMAGNRQRFGSELLESVAIDREASLEGNWVGASSITSNFLTRKLKQPPKLYFYPGAVYEITFNRQGHHAQSQLAVLAKMPTRDEIRSFQPVDVFVAPEGVKSIPANLKTETDFLDANFKRVSVGQAPSHVQYMGFGFQAKRQQYGLRPRIAATIHAAMGQDLPAIITKVDGDKKYRLFQREQVVVLLSRTHFAKHIYFVGDPDATARLLWEALQVRSTYDAYLEYLMKQLTNRGVSVGRYQNVINAPAFHPYRPIDHEMPTAPSGYAYVLASLHRHYIGQATYIGQTRDLVQRYRRHREGTATEQTADPEMRPWILLGYISGFEGCSKSARMQFESLWQGTRNRENENRQIPLTAEEVASLGERLVHEREYTRFPELQDKKLVYHRCGAIFNHPVVATEIS